MDPSDDGSSVRGNADSDSDNEICGDGSGPIEPFSDAESFYDTLKAEFKAGKGIDSHGTYPVPADALVSPRQRVQMVVTELWSISGYRFTVKDHKKLKSGHRTRLWCSQDEARKKKSKALQNPDIRNRDHLGMKRFSCGSKLSVSCRARRNDERTYDVIVQLKHAGKHISYEDVSMPPEALDMVRDNVQWLTPVAMVTKVQATFPSVTSAQIHRAWMEMSQPFWCFDKDQLLSTKKLLEEHTDDSDGDVDNTNSKHLELYSIMGEQDGAGFPLSYLLLSTASSIDQGKRTQALTAWAKCLWDTYGIDAKFTHVDKDMAEIKMLKDVWDAKISLCWWHLRQSVRRRARAHAEFSFIDVAFIPAEQADGGEYEGGIPETVTPVVPASRPQTITMANGLVIRIPARPPPASASPNTAAAAASTTRSETERTPEDPRADLGRVLTSIEGTEKKTRCTFCPPRYHDAIVNMMEKHYCAHPLLPGYAPPNPDGIKCWAVSQMYKFCVDHGLREVWAYLWENWYRRSRWELWARSVNPEIPVLKTTMILESHWRCIKHDFLHHFHMPRCDLLAWILIVKLAPSYYRKLDR
ncbi:hypothetical protein GGX14DRAFT_674827 [Mycena pura]|uniref:MULE transposase domain-containing protein n=1 Tax=Mycena pura TaxID=153505 RepID=A0AAD6VR53_9AGAR|nr:hypothetical protein GGX14DRAFT_674827 [Mycena pura]